MRILLVIIVFVATQAIAVDIPILNWQQRSDWINVKTNIPSAIGNGIADDTVALQAALNATNIGKTIYIPDGTYKITQTLHFTNNTASAVIGNGRNTRLVWAGASGGRMFWSDGNPYTRYIGLSWDGAGMAAVGFDHASTTLFETEIQHVNEAYRNFTTAGIRVGNSGTQASAEILYYNCLFVNCSNGVSMLAFNDYDNTIDRCEFENCGIAIACNHGNFYARNSHFQNSSTADLYAFGEHGSSIRRCTSTGSKYFVQDGALVAPTTIEDCQVANWTASDTAINLSSAPVTMFDCAFTGGPPGSFPVKSTYGSQLILISSNTPSSVSALISGIPAGRIYQITNGTKTGVLTNANQIFLQQTASIPTHNLDAKLDFGAVGNGVADDTTAIQATINAAKTNGNGAIAYIPAGSYKITQTLLVTGTNYSVGGSGRKTCLNWSGGAGLPFVLVSNVQNVTLSDMGVGTHDCTVGNNGYDILVTGSTSCTLGIDGVFVYGKYDNSPNSHGLHFDSLPSGSSVVSTAVEGNIQITNCASASLLFPLTYEGTLTMRGPASTNNLAGFLTRLTTVAMPALQVFDNQSLVMSDFYVEQSQQVATFSGATNQSPGNITIQSPKEGMNTNLPCFAISNYSGRIYYGQTQFYVQTPTNTIFQSTNALPLQLILSGDYWYNTSPLFKIDANTSLTLMGNNQSMAPDSGITTSAMAGIGSALDDLRMLGQLDSIFVPPYIEVFTNHVGTVNSLRVQNLFTQ